MVHRVDQTPLLGLHMYDAPGVYSDGSPVMLYGDGVFCATRLCGDWGDTALHAELGAPVGKLHTEAKATTVSTAIRRVFMAWGF